MLTFECYGILLMKYNNDIYQYFLLLSLTTFSTMVIMIVTMMIMR